MTLVVSALATLAAVLTLPDQHPRAPKPPPPPPPSRVALASWYDDAGATASGRHYTYGFAALIFGSDWGHRVRMCHLGRCAVGRLDDHGPYVGGRTFDLNPALRDALGCPDLCTVHW